MKHVAFYPGKSLRAEDFHSLEDYLLSRNNLLDQNYGVLEFRNSVDYFELQVGHGGVNAKVCLKKIKGITKSGKPVVLYEDSKIWSEGVVVGQIYDFLVGFVQSDNNNENRYTLLTVNQPNEDEDIIVNEDQIFIGRYFIQNGGLVLIKRPKCYHLRSFNYATEDWTTWIFPLKDAIIKFNQNFDPSRSIILSELYFDLLSRYEVIPLNQLERMIGKLLFIKELIQDQHIESEKILLDLLADDSNHEELMKFENHELDIHLQTSQDLPLFLAQKLGGQGFGKVRIIKASIGFTKEKINDIEYSKLDFRNSNLPDNANQILVELLDFNFEFVDLYVNLAQHQHSVVSVQPHALRQGVNVHLFPVHIPANLPVAFNFLIKSQVFSQSDYQAANFYYLT